MEAIRMQQTVQKRGELTLRNLPVEKGQHVEVLLLFSPAEKSNRPRLTARQLLHSDIIVLWMERRDITDSTTYARQLREKAQKRPGIGGITDDTAGQ
jgi:hypothetical protein